MKAEAFPVDAATGPADAGAQRLDVRVRRDGAVTESQDWLADEVPVALIFNGISHAVMLATPLALVTAVGAISLAAPRRNEVLMTLVFPLAAAALSRGTAALLSGGQWSSKQAFSPPN